MLDYHSNYFELGNTVKIQQETQVTKDGFIGVTLSGRYGPGEIVVKKLQKRAQILMIHKILFTTQSDNQNIKNIPKNKSLKGRIKT